MKKLILIVISSFLFSNFSFAESVRNGEVTAEDISRVNVDSDKEQKKAAKLQKELEKAQRRAKRRAARLQRQIKRTQKRANKKTSRLQKKLKKTNKKIKKETAKLENEMQEHREEVTESVRENELLADCNVSNNFQNIICPDGKVYKLSTSENELPRHFIKNQDGPADSSLIQEAPANTINQ